jgi:hypothetical protein
MQQTHIVHVDIALHKSEKSDYIQTIERRVLSNKDEAELASRCREIPMNCPLDRVNPIRRLRTPPPSASPI